MRSVITEILHLVLLPLWFMDIESESGQFYHVSLLWSCNKFNSFKKFNFTKISIIYMFFLQNLLCYFGQLNLQFDIPQIHNSVSGCLQCWHSSNTWKQGFLFHYSVLYFYFSLVLWLNPLSFANGTLFRVSFTYLHSLSSASPELW